MAKQKTAPGQMPLFPPESDWTRPTELPDWRGQDFALDLETRDDGLGNDMGPGWAYSGMGWIAGVGVAVRGRPGVYVPVRHPDTDNFDKDAVIRWVTDHARAAKKIVFQNAPYDIGWLWRDFGIEPFRGDQIVDTMAEAVMIDENRMGYGMDALCRWRGIPGKNEEKLREAAAAFGYDSKSELWKMPAKYVGAYGEQDPVATLGLHDSMWPHLVAEDTVGAFQREMNLVPMVHKMRRRGIRIDVDHCMRVQAQLRERVRLLLDQLSDKLMIGRKVTVDDINSPRWMENVFTAQKIDFPRTGKTHQGSFSKDWMEVSEHWLPRTCAAISKYNDASEKFVGKYLMGFVSGGRIHAEIHQYRSDDGGTRSQRFSYSDPPLQQMPARDAELATLIRGAFLPEEGDVWAACDYSQQEYRLIVHFAQACGMAGVERAVQMYREDPNTDFHMLVVKLTGLERKPAKDTNFAKAFGAGVNKFALMIGKSKEEAAAIYKQYDEEMPFVSRLAQFCQSRAEKRGSLRLLDGARAHFDDWEPRWRDYKKEQAGIVRGFKVAPCGRAEAIERTNTEGHPWFREGIRRAWVHKAMNRLIQGSAARQTKMAMEACYAEGLLPMIQMHDELGFSFGSKRDLETAIACMRDVVKLEVPVMVDAECGKNWGHAQAIKNKETKEVIYGATFEEAMAVVRAGG